MAITHFGDALIEKTRALGHPLCVGLDPHLSLIPDLFRRGTMVVSDPQTAEVVEAFCFAVLDRVAGQIAVLLQIVYRAHGLQVAGLGGNIKRLQVIYPVPVAETH